LIEQFKDKINKNFSLNGLNGIVTGGSSGIGKSIAITLASAGAEVHVFSRTGHFKKDKVDNNRIHHYKIDVTNIIECQVLIEQIGKNGLDFLVNNAGISEKVNFENLSSEVWEKIEKLNLNTPIFLSKYSFPYLKQSANVGRIINIASMASHLAFNEVSPYTITKTAILGLTRSLAVEWADKNILINSVSPGWIKTDLLEKIVDEERENKILGRMPLHRYGEPEDIANMVWFLVSPASKYITGQDFAVDGGALCYGY
jgi:NAD(P)-dependent dehydrogenase (short-subunit alcohol dehydrogenase family)